MNTVATMIKMIGLILRDRFSRNILERQPEPSLVMDDPDNVRHFHEQGNPDAPMAGLYHFNALCLSLMVPENGTVLDLGCGSGQFLKYFALSRPDTRLIGLDLSESMIALGQNMIRQSGLVGQVDLRIADMTDFTHAIDGPVDAISCIYAFHHLPGKQALRRCLESIRKVHECYGCSLWFFDHVRPRHSRTAEVFPRIATPLAPPAFQVDSCNSLKASFSYEALSATIDEIGIGPVHHLCSRLLRLLQVHWLESCHGTRQSHKRLWKAASPPPPVYRDYRMLASILQPDILSRAAG